MNVLEHSIRREAQSLGWSIYRNGWPDYLLYNEEANQVIGIEVKSTHDKLSKCQERMHAILKHLGIETYVVRSIAQLPSPALSKYERKLYSKIWRNLSKLARQTERKAQEE